MDFTVLISQLIEHWNAVFPKKICVSIFMNFIWTNRMRFTAKDFSSLWYCKMTHKLCLRVVGLYMLARYPHRTCLLPSHYYHHHRTDKIAEQIKSPLLKLAVSFPEHLTNMKAGSIPCMNVFQTLYYSGLTSF